MWKNRRDAIVTPEGYGSELHCPECGQGYLHQGNTTIYERVEDDKWTTVIAQSGHDVNVTKFPSGDTHNPSSRRHGLIIEFTCEMCHSHYDSEGATPEFAEPFRLAIYQHKGNTLVEWVS